MSSTHDDTLLSSLSLDYLNLLINGQAFSDVTFSVEGRLVHAHRCVLAARSPFFRRFFSGPPGWPVSQPAVTVNSVGYEAFMVMLRYLYGGHVPVVPRRDEKLIDPRAECEERGGCHVDCTAAVDLAIDTIAAARSFGVEQLALITQKQLSSMVEKASIDNVIKVLIIASRTQEMHQLFTTCSHLLAKSPLPIETLAEHLPIDVVAKIEHLRLNSSLTRCHHHHHLLAGGADQKLRRMHRALVSSDIELVKLMVMREGLNLDEALALHYAVENCSREVVKALLELGMADVNYRAGPAGKTPLHVAAEMVSPEMVAVLLDHHADPGLRTVDGVTPLHVLRALTSDYLFKGPGSGSVRDIEPNKLRLCLELVQSAAMVISREEGRGSEPSSSATIYPPEGNSAVMNCDGDLMNQHHSHNQHKLN